MKKHLLFLLASLFYQLHTANSQVLYSSTISPGYSFNAGRGTGPTNFALFDDIQIPSSQIQGTDSIRVTKIKLGLRREAGAPAVSVEMFYTLLNPATTSYDDFIKVPPVLLGSVSLGANGASTAKPVITLGDSIHTLFAVKTDTGNYYPGYQVFFLGLRFSDSSKKNGWAVTTPGGTQSRNDDIMLIYDVDHSDSTFSAYFGGTPSTTFYAQVFGNTAPLPVSLTSFSVQRSGKTGLLKWVTAQELNLGYFDIERSRDGIAFTSIGQIEAKSRGSLTTEYVFNDNALVKGFNYYRLRMVDKDNNIKLSEIKRIKNFDNVNMIIYPNPVAANLMLDIDADLTNQTEVVIHDINGKMLIANKVILQKGNNLISVPVNNLAAGSYMVSVTIDGHLTVQNFQKL